MMPSKNIIDQQYRSETRGVPSFEVPGYEIKEKLSANPAYTIYRGQRSQDLLPVVLKVLNQPSPTPKRLAPLWQEFEILRLLDVPGVEKAYALERYEQWWMIVLEDGEGQPVCDLELAGRMQPEEFLHLALQLAEIIDAIHARQVIHKNISPSNIYYSPSKRQARLTNFGYASLISKEKVPFQSPYKLADYLAYSSPELTGRMNRNVDYRTDYYSLGATLYELLTGSPPFVGKTPLELVHAHLAILPDPPDTRVAPWSSSPVAFQVISAILLKLLAKNPEDRYQTPASLQVDLRYCLSILKESVDGGTASSGFNPGQSDHPVELNFPQVVVGRHKETEMLIDAFRRTLKGPKEMVLVSGETGVGKTTLVNQIVRPVTEYKSLFLYAKADLARHVEVYPLLIDLLNEFCRLILSEPASSFKEWQERIQFAVAPHGKLLTDLCPQLETIIGPQMPVEPLDNESVRPRFHQVVNRLFQAICHSNHHVVMFLDNLQWISSDSLLLWKSIYSNPSLQNLLIVGAFREEELDKGHPVHSLLEEVRTIQGDLLHIQLHNLQPRTIQKLIAATLSSSPAEISELSSLVYQKTGGNPYYSIEFLKSLYKDKLLVFNPEDGRWHWDGNRIDEYSIANTPVDFFVHEMVNLDAATRKVLQYASLIGRHFDAADLLAILGQDQADTIAFSLWKAIQLGLIYPLDADYRSLLSEFEADFRTETGGPLPSLADLLEEHILFEFVDTHVQQAATAMLDEQQIKSLSLQIGWRLLEKAEQAGHEAIQKNLLLIVDHLNEGRLLIESTSEAIRAAQLNLMAGNMVRSLAAFKAASGYLFVGIQLLPADNWITHYQLSLELYVAGAEVARMNGDLESAEKLALIAEANAGTLLEKVGIMNIRMDTCLVQNQLDEVIELGITAIRLLDFNLEVEEPSVLDVEKALQVSSTMTDPDALAVSSLVESLVSASYTRNSEWFTKILHFYINLFSRYGNPSSAGHVYIVYAVHLLGHFKDMERACRLGRMALELAERQGPSRNLYTVRFIYYAFINHWLGPARDSLFPLEENIQLAHQFGSLEFTKNSLDLWFQNSLFVGDTLEQIQEKQVKAFRYLDQFDLQSFRMEVWSRVVTKLLNEAPRTSGHRHTLFDDNDPILHMVGQSQIRWFNLYTAQAHLSFYFRDPEQALRAAEAADEIKVTAMTHLLRAEHLFIYSLALLSPNLEAGKWPERKARVEENLLLMGLWAEAVPQNYLHQAELVKAELARCLGHDEEAAAGYERAIRHAKENGYIHHKALAAELASEFYIARGAFTAAKEHVMLAYPSYLAWGATAKVKDLVNRYPEWLPPDKEEEKPKFISSSENSSRDELTTSIDLHTILKASMELAQETNLEELLRKLMSILMENTGAQSGSLLLNENDRWFLKVQLSTGPEQRFSVGSTPLAYLSPQAGRPYLPISIIHYVINLKESLVLEDASASRQFNRDAYIQSRHPKSILCAPLLNQGVLIGIVYLENNLASGVFTTDRLEIVGLLSGQAAVSIEKARLYGSMETLVEARTRELSNANQRLKNEIDERIRFEKALRLSEERYRRVFESTGTAMAVIDEEGILTLFNEKFVQLTGHAREDLENHFNALSMIAPDDLTRIEHIRKEALTNPFIVPYSFEIRVINKSGEEKVVIATTSFLPGSKSIIASLIDISERKLAEEALHYNEALLRRVMDILPVGLWILDQDAKVVRGNPEAFHIWAGVEYKEWREFDKYKAWRLDTGEKITPETWAATRSIASGEIILGEELEIEAFDGTHRIILNSAMPLSTEENGLIGAIAINQDITDRKRNEDELRAAHDQLSTLLEISQSIVSTLDLDHLLDVIIEQLGKVLPYHAAAILIIEQGNLKFRMIRGPAEFQRLLAHQIPSSDLTIIEALLKRSEAIYLADLHEQDELIDQIQQTLDLPASQFSYLRSWLVLPLVAKGDLIGCLVLTHSQPDFYSSRSQSLAQAYANEVAIAIHNAQLYRQAADNAALEERNRLARDLHDSVAQALYSISLFIDATRMALRTNRPQVVENHLEELTLLAREAMSDMRLMIFELRPPILEKVGLAAALQSRLEAVESRAGFQASFFSKGNIQLSPEQQEELYRIAQEALNNVIKHAHAHHVNVLVAEEGGSIRLVIEDDGLGFDPSIAEYGGGQGFRNMQERAARIGASCRIESIPGQGTKVTVELIR